MIELWLNKKYLDKKYIAKLKKQYLSAKPFPHLKLDDFLQEDKFQEVLKALLSQEFIVKESDLFSLKQTNDFKGTENEFLTGFRHLLGSGEFLNLIHEITGEKLIVQMIDCNGSVYEKNDYLLAHDDRLDSRKIAYIYYLSTLSKEDGGSLDLYKCKKETPISVEKSLFPKENSFAFFKVSKNSFHQVSEVISNSKRISINGWLHK